MKNVIFLMLLASSLFSQDKPIMTGKEIAEKVFPSYEVLEIDTLICFTKKQGHSILQTYDLLDKYKSRADSMESLREIEIDSYKELLKNKNKEIDKIQEIVDLKDAEIRILKKSYDDCFTNLKDKTLQKKKINWTEVFKGTSYGVLATLVIIILAKQ